MDRDIFLMPQNPAAWPPIRRNRARISGRVVVVLRRV
jgi:SOS-response transcriptional repressor LexA